jgi:hypothetical protein
VPHSVIMFLLRVVALKADMILSCSEKSTDKLEQLCQVICVKHSWGR